MGKFTIIIFFIFSWIPAYSNSCHDQVLEGLECSSNNLAIIELSVLELSSELEQRYSVRPAISIQNYNSLLEQMQSLGRLQDFVMQCKSEIPKYKYNSGSCFQLPDINVFVNYGETPTLVRISHTHGFFMREELSSQNSENRCYTTSIHQMTRHNRENSFTLSQESDSETFISSFFVKDEQNPHYRETNQMYNLMGAITSNQHIEPEWGPSYSIQKKEIEIAQGAFKIECDQFYNSKFSYSCSYKLDRTQTLPNGYRLNQNDQSTTLTIESSRDAKRLFRKMSNQTSFQTGPTRSWNSPAGDVNITCREDGPRNNDVTRPISVMGLEYSCEIQMIEMNRGRVIYFDTSDS